MKKLNFAYSGQKLLVTGYSVEEDPRTQWNPEINKIEYYCINNKEFTIDFKLNGYNSTTSLYLTQLVKNCEDMSRKCKITINWYFLEADEDLEFKGEVYQDMTKKCKFNLISVKGMEL